MVDPTSSAPDASTRSAFGLSQRGLRLMEALAEEILRRRDTFAKLAVHMVLGTDREIGKDEKSLEKRVGITPEQARTLMEFCANFGVECKLHVVRGAGVRAGFADEHYISAGAEVVEPWELEHHECAMDLVHALKEPSSYEAKIRGPFLRLGATHTGDFSERSGLAGLLQERNAEKTFAAIFDGSNIGSGYRIPIRGEMSRFAGRIGAGWISSHLGTSQTGRRVVVVGGGYVGRAAVTELARSPVVERVDLFDRGDRLGDLQALFDGGKVHVSENETVDGDALLGALREADALLLAVAKHGERAPKVLRIESVLGSLRKGGIAVDICIDEGGGIYDPDIVDTSKKSDIIRNFELKLARNSSTYKAIANMPRAIPREASYAHGEAVLPYLATLLYLAARHGGPTEAVDALCKIDPAATETDPLAAAEAGKPVLDHLLQDLRNGLAFYRRILPPGMPGETPRGRLCVENIVAARKEVFKFLAERSIEFAFKSRPTGEDGRKRAEEHAALESFPETARANLKIVVNEEIDATIVFHPDRKLGTAVDAAGYLGVEPADVVKCLVCRKKTSGKYFAAIVEGTKRYDRWLNEEDAELATPQEVAEITKCSVKSVPVLGIFDRRDRVERVYVSNRVLERNVVVGCSGAENMGIQFSPKVLLGLGAEPVQMAPPDSLVRKHSQSVEGALGRIREAMTNDDDHIAREAVAQLGGLLSAPGSQNGTSADPLQDSQGN